jgi:hypothetical protein
VCGFSFCCQVQTVEQHAHVLLGAQRLCTDIPPLDTERGGISKSYVLKKIAADLCGQLGLKSMKDIADLSDEKIDELKITISQKRVLKALREACVIIYLNSISV